MRAQIGWLSINRMNRHRPFIMAIEAGLFAIGCCFWIETMLAGSAFTADIWGDLAYSIPAQFWALANMSVSALTLAGLMKPIKNWMVALGAGLSCVQYIVLSWSAIFDGGAAVIGMYASILLLPMHIWLLFEAVTNDE